MLSFDLRALRTAAATVDADLAPDDEVWQEGDPLPDGPVHVTGRLSAAGSDRYYWHGQIEGAVKAPCRRCLTETRAGMREEAHVLFSEGAEEDADDPDVVQLAPGAAELDLREVVREQWLLNAPRYPLCREDCRGLCPKCGADLNAGDCGCPTTTDSRWDALRKATG